MLLDDDLALAIRLADRADEIALGRFRAVDLQVNTKPDRSPVTEADLAVERAIRDLLTAERPSDGILGEEFGTEGSTSRQWIIDPIDGTANFLRGVPIWGALIALAIDGVPVLSVVSAPALGRRWWASQGNGAFTTDAPGGTPRRLQVSSVSSLDDASISFQSVAQWREAGRLEQMLTLTEQVWRDRGYGDLWPYMMVAEGVLDLTSEFGVQVYDLAALQPIIEEAGGRFTAVNGDAGPWHGNALATNGLIHEAALAILNA